MVDVRIIMPEQMATLYCSGLLQVQMLKKIIDHGYPSLPDSMVGTISVNVYVISGWALREEKNGAGVKFFIANFESL